MAESVFLTGATGLIGKVLAKNFLEHGYRVIVTSRSKEKLEALCNEFERKNIFDCQVDLLADDSIDVIRNFLESNTLKPNYLVNNARSLEFLKTTDFRQIDKSQWLGEYALDVVVPYNLTMLLSGMSDSRLKSVVNVSSMYGLLAYNDYLCEGAKSIAFQYGAAKAALIQLTRQLAVSLAPKHIRVNAISYGGVAGRADEAFQRRYATLCPERKMLSKDEIAGHALYLCSDASAGMTGHNLIVDGGFSTW